MPALTVNIPANVVADLTAAADELLAARGISIVGMTTTQRGQRYIAEILKDVVITRRRATAQTTAQTTVDTAVATATTDAAGIA